MPKTIQDSVTLKAKPSKLYSLYADSKLHTAATGAKASVGSAPKGRFSAFDGKVTGKMLQTVKNKMIVQTWRGKDWGKSDQDSVLVMTFEDAKDGGKVSLVQTNVPDRRAAAIKSGWKKMYWSPWRKYLADAAKPAAKKAPAKKAAAKKKPARRTAAKRKPAARKTTARGARRR